MNDATDARLENDVASSEVRLLDAGCVLDLVMSRR